MIMENSALEENVTQISSEDESIVVYNTFPGKSDDPILSTKTDSNSTENAINDRVTAFKNRNVEELINQLETEHKKSENLRKRLRSLSTELCCTRKDVIRLRELQEYSKKLFESHLGKRITNFNTWLKEQIVTGDVFTKPSRAKLNHDVQALKARIKNLESLIASKTSRAGTVPEACDRMTTTSEEAVDQQSRENRIHEISDDKCTMLGKSKSRNETQDIKTRALQSRSNYLSQELKEAKTKIHALVEKGMHDSEFINALIEKNRNLAQECEEKNKNATLMEEQYYFKEQNLASLRAINDAEIRKLKEIIEARNEKVRLLNEKIKESSRSTKDKCLGTDGVTVDELVSQGCQTSFPIPLNALDCENKLPDFLSQEYNDKPRIDPTEPAPRIETYRNCLLDADVDFSRFISTDYARAIVRDAGLRAAVASLVMNRVERLQNALVVSCARTDRLQKRLELVSLEPES